MGEDGALEEFGRCRQKMEEFLVKVANPKSEEENVVEADWVDEQQGVEGRLLVQLAIPGVGRF